MDGKFIKNKTPVLAVLLLISGICEVLFFGSILAGTGLHGGRDSRVAIIGLGLSVALCVFCVLAIWVRRNMRLHIENEHISATLRFGKTLEVDFSEIEYVEAGLGVLTIMLKSGKRHIITGLRNWLEICDCILNGLETVEETADRETLARELRELTEKRKMLIGSTCFLIMLWFADILLCVMLTGKKDFTAFTGREWIIFGVMMCQLLGMVVLTFVLASRAGGYLHGIQNRRHRLRKLLLDSDPLGMGKCRKIYADNTALIRVVIYGYPNAEDVYLAIEAIDRHLRLCQVYESPVYPGEEEMLKTEKLPRPLEGMRVVYAR